VQTLGTFGSSVRFGATSYEGEYVNVISYVCGMYLLLGFCLGVILIVVVAIHQEKIQWGLEGLKQDPVDGKDIDPYLKMQTVLDLNNKQRLLMITTFADIQIALMMGYQYLKKRFTK
jgi:hypothetical protein